MNEIIKNIEAAQLKAEAPAFNEKIAEKIQPAQFPAPDKE